MPTRRLHVFTSSANLVISSLTGNPDIDTVEYLVVGGGGGAGAFQIVNSPTGHRHSGSGGGAGGMRTGNILLSQANVNTYTVTVGAGGTSNVRGNSSTFLDITSLGGGAGWGQPGGSGGGGMYFVGGTPIPGGSGVPGQGNSGGSANAPPDPQFSVGGNGGGGAGGAGGPAPRNFPGSHDRGANGGIGAQVTWVPASYGTTGPTPGRWFGGGGSGGGYTQFAFPDSAGYYGGAGGGGNSLGLDAPVPARAGTTNTGGGGAGVGNNNNPNGVYPGGTGGSGIVIIRYSLVDIAPTVQSRVSRVSNVTANTSAPGFVAFGSNIVFAITTTNGSNGESMYYYTSGNASLFSSSNTGTLVFNANSATVTLTTASTLSNFTLNVKRNEESSAVLYTSNTISIITALYNNAIGGNVIIEGDYKLHVFLTSNTFQVLTVGGLDSNISYAVLAGGGGYNGPTNTGGGGGGLIQGNISLAPYGAGNLAIIIGSGGTGSPSAASSPGGFSYIKNSSNALYLEALGGGAGGIPGFGGCGGGITGPAPANHPLGIGVGIPGQGFPGGFYNPAASGPGAQGTAGGGGAGGAGGPGRYLGNPLYGIGGNGANIHIAPQGHGYYGGSVNPAVASVAPTAITHRWFGGGGSAGFNTAPIRTLGLQYNPAVIVYAPAPSSPSPFGFVPSQRMGTGTGGGGDGEATQSGIVFIKYKYK